MIPYGRQFISDEDIKAVVSVLRSDYLTQGEMVPRFEAAVASKLGAKHGVAVNSATSALHIACLALDVGLGDMVWTVPNTFVASANCALYCGASVDFVDIDPTTYNMDAGKLSEKCAEAAQAGTLPKVVIPVHFAGQPCDMAAISVLAKKYGFRVIEDASHAVGASYGNSMIGNCRHSDIVILSFHPVKIITTAEGGMALTNNARMATRMASLRSHGITRNAAEMIGEFDGPWYYEQQALGFNYRMTELQAALGISQLQNLDDWVARRQEIARRYDTALENINVVVPLRQAGSRSALHLYPIQVDNRREVFHAMRASDIGVNVHYIPVHLQPYYAALGFRRGQFPVAERYYSRAISLPMYATLTNEQQGEVVAALEAAVK